MFDLLEDRERCLDTDRTAHIKSCESCRLQVRALREVILEAGDLTVPEPSPLYWEHSKRVSEAVAADARAHHVFWWHRLSLSRLTTAVTTATVVLAVVRRPAVPRCPF